MRSKRRTRKQRGGNAMPNIYIVYFAYLDVGSDDWSNSRAKKLVLAQLKELSEIGLSEAAKEIHVVITSPKRSNFNNSSVLKLDKAKRNIETESNAYHDKVRIHVERGNAYEYPGLRCVWEIAREIPEGGRKNSVILYFHAKGMSNGDKGSVKTSENTMLTDTVIKPWREIVARFGSEPGLNKAGHSAAKDGWIWYNFWWVRASYLMDSPRPILTDRRHYYEDWLGRRIKDAANNDVEAKEAGDFSGAADCLSLCKEGAGGKLGVHLHPAFEKC